MNHSEIKNQLDAYLDGEVSVSKAEEIRLHLEVCADCRLQREEWLKIKAAFLNPPERAGSESFVFKVMEDIRAEKRPFNLLELVRWTVPTFAVMAAALILITGVLFESDHALAVETAILKGDALFTAPEFLDTQKDETSDWMGIEAL